MRILALLVLAVSVDALHAVHPAASVLLKPAIRARAQRHLLSIGRSFNRRHTGLCLAGGTDPWHLAGTD
eukprot:scaffold82271_cov66-Phaeocystis_antarctica.AAC.3